LLNYFLLLQKNMKKNLIYLKNIDFLPKEVQEYCEQKNYKLLFPYKQNILIKEWLVKWCIAMQYCNLDYKNYLPKEVLEDLHKILIKY